MYRFLSYIFFLLILINYSFNHLFASDNISDDKYDLIFNIICHDNKAGLSKDYKILKEELTQLGCKVNHVNIQFCVSSDEITKIKNAAQTADVNIFIEHLFEELFPLAGKNFFIPNPDYCFASDEVISKLDLILCRTQETKRIFKPLNPNIFFLGFTSVDKSDSSIKKNYKKFLHLSTNQQKGTNTIFNIWSSRPNHPNLTVVRGFSKDPDPNIPKLSFINYYVPEEDMNILQNRCGIHLCPSETEGFGHYIVEAMSTGAVVITTDAPPMNEFINDKRCLVAYGEIKTQRLATSYCVDPTLLNASIENLLNLSREELEEIGQNNRIEYLKGKRTFQKRLRQLISLTQNAAPAMHPPVNFVGKMINKNTYRLSWKKSPDVTVIAYHLYKNGKFIKKFSKKGPFKYEGLSLKKGKIVYSLVSVNNQGLKSKSVRVTL